MNIIRKLKPYEECKLQVVTSNKTFQAILEFVDPQTTKIGLSDIHVLPSMKREIGLQVLYPDDIISYSVIDDQKIKTSNSSDVQQPIAILAKNYSGWLKNDSESSDDDEEASVQAEEEEEREFVLELPESFQNMLPHDHAIIDCINESFHAAIKHINEQDLIGVSFEANDVDRFGELSIVGISTEWCTFLFDILVLKEDAFKKGLKRIFENPNVEKIIHNCVHPADMAFRLYNTEFNHVFDTRLANVYIKNIHNRNGKAQDKLWTVRQCIEKYLGIQREEFSILSNYVTVLKGAPPNWDKRPLPYSLRAFAIHNVIFLRHLRYACIMNILDEFYRGVNLLKDSLRNCSSESLQFGDVDLDLIFSGMNIKYVQMSDYVGGNKRKSLEAYLHKTKDYEVFKPLSTVQDNSCATGHSSERIVTSATNKKKTMMEEIMFNNASVHQGKASLSEEDTMQNTVPKKDSIIFEKHLISKPPAKEDIFAGFETPIRKGTMTRAGLPVKENAEFNWSTAEEIGYSGSESLSLIPAGISIAPAQRKSQKF